MLGHFQHQSNYCKERNLIIPYNSHLFIVVEFVVALAVDADVDVNRNRVFHGFGQAKLGLIGLVKGFFKFSLLPQLPQKTTFAAKVVKIDSKIIILLW